MDFDIIVEIEKDEGIILDALAHLKSAFLTEDQAKHTKEYYIKILQHAEFIVAKCGEQIDGICALYVNDTNTRIAYITLIGVMPNAQNRGVGTLLLAKAFDLAKKRGMVTIRLEVLKKNESAKTFYIRNGFAEIIDKDHSVIMEFQL